MSDLPVDLLADKMRRGVGLKDAVQAEGLPWKATRTVLAKEHRAIFREAKAEQREAIKEAIRTKR